MLQHAKSVCKSFLLRFGYEIRAVRQPVIDNVDYEAALTVKESQYYSRWLGPCPLFSPWSGHPEFQAIYEGAKRYTVVSPDRCYILISLGALRISLGGRLCRMRSIQRRDCTFAGPRSRTRRQKETVSIR